MSASPVTVGDFARDVALEQPYTLSDVGNAERLRDRHGGDLHHAAGHGWLVWDGTRWMRDEDGEVVRRMTETIKSLYGAAERLDDPKERQRLARHALASERETRIRAAITLTCTLEGIVVNDRELDADPWLLNCANGTLDLRTGELREHRRADLLTRITPIAYDPQAACPTWLAFLDRVLAGDEAMVEFLRRAVGYSLTGETSEQVLLMLYGTGANGKTVAIETIRALLGEYAMQTPADTFLERRSDGIRNDVARLRGARFVSAVEMPEGKRLDEVLVKRLVGGDMLTARFLHREHFEFKPAFTPWVATNHRPTVRGVDDGIWRRIRLVPFTVTIPEGERDPQLAERLRGELPGILAWAVEGCRAWRADGLDAPEAVTSATATYRADMDVLGAFVDERCVTGDGISVKAGDLYAAYHSWAEAAGERDPLTRRALGLALSDRGFTPGKGSGGVRIWTGLGLLPEEPR